MNRIDFFQHIGTIEHIRCIGGFDIALAKYDVGGNYLRAMQTGGPQDDYTGPLKVCISGGFRGSNVDFDPGPGTAFLNSAGGMDIYNARYSRDVTGIKEPDGETGMNVILDHTFPNPASNSTVIGFSITKEEHIKLKISDLFGTELKMIMNEVKQPGRYLVEADVSDLGAGIYFYSITSTDLMITRKMMVIK